MRARITLLFFLSYPSTLCGQVTEMSVRDSTILRSISMFLDSMVSNGLQSKEFVIGATITKLEVNARTMQERSPSENLEYPQSEFKCSYNLVLSAQTESMVSDQRVATCKFKYRNKVVYIFFGAEFFVKYSEGDRKKLRKSEPRGVGSGGQVICTMICEIEGNRIDGVLFVK